MAHPTHPKWPSRLPETLSSADFFTYAEWMGQCWDNARRGGQLFRHIKPCPTRGVSYALFLCFPDLFENSAGLAEYYPTRIMLATFIGLALQDEGL